MARYDRTMKRLTSVFTLDYVRFALGADVARVEALEIQEQDKELPALSREVDFVARVGWRGSDALLLMEFQTRWQTDMPLRMAGYTWRLHERYGESVHPVVVVLRPGGVQQGEWRMDTWERTVAYCRFDVVALWKMSAAEVISQELTGLYPLLPLMRWETDDAVAVLEESQRLILEGPLSGESQADAYVALRVLSGIAQPASLVQRILRRRELMLESPVYEEIMEEGRREGREEGRVEGREEGLEEGIEQRLRADILTTLSVRFGTVLPALAERVRAYHGQDVLEGVFHRALVAGSLEEFAQGLE